MPRESEVWGCRICGKTYVDACTACKCCDPNMVCPEEGCPVLKVPFLEPYIQEEKKI